MWLELSETNEVIGIHSHQTGSPNKQVEIDDSISVDLGDSWVNGNVQQMDRTLDPVSIRQKLAADNIAKYYPIWKQLNVIRENNSEEVIKMGNFIDACRMWSNDLLRPMEEIESIKP